MRGYPQHHFYGPRFFGSGLGMLFALLIIGLLVYLVVLARQDRDRKTVVSRPADPVPPPATGPLTPFEVVKMRYARGEITREEYEMIRRDLE
jgi:uncharacterized membrane protein